MSEDEDKGELKDRDYLREVADWMERMPCDWRVCQETLGNAAESISRLQVNAKVAFVSLMTLANLTKATILENEKDTYFDELLAMADAMTDDIIKKENLKAAAQQRQAAMLGMIIGKAPSFTEGYR